MNPERLAKLQSLAVGPTSQSDDARRLWIAQMRAAIVEMASEIERLQRDSPHEAWVVRSVLWNGSDRPVAVYRTAVEARKDYPNEALYPVEGPFELRK